MWLCGPDAPVLAPSEIARVLGLSLQEVGDTTLMRAAVRFRGLCFTVAVLRDLFPTDAEVRAWVQRPHGELGGRRPIDLLRAAGSGAARAVEELATAQWRRAQADASGQCHDDACGPAGLWRHFPAVLHSPA